MLILAAGPAEFAAYERGIRFEYAFVEEAAYRRARAAVLGTFLESERIFRHPVHLRHEPAARTNIKRLIEELLQPDPS